MDQPSVPRSARLGVLAIGVFVSGGAAAGFVLARDARPTEPFEPSAVAVPVEVRTLERAVVTRGTIGTIDRVEVAGSGDGIVTRVDAPVDEQVNEGDAIIEVDGRPRLALEGELPAYRTMLPGSEGDDVAQVESALARLGFDPGSVDGVYDRATAAAVDAWYRDRGYPPPSPASELVDAAQVAADAAAAAFEAVAVARARLDEAARPADADDIAVADADVVAAYSQLVAAQARADASRALAADRVASTAAAARAADLAARRAMAAWHDARAAGDPAQQELGVEAERLRAAHDTAQSEAAAAAREQPAVDAEADAQIAAAQAALDAAGARRRRLDEAPDTAALSARVADAEERLAVAKEGALTADVAAGTPLPFGEVVFVDGLPRVVVATPAASGDTAEGPLVVLGGATTTVEFTVTAAEADLIDADTPIEVDDAGTGLDTTGALSSMVAGEGGTVVVNATLDDPAAHTVVGANVRVSIAVDHSAGPVPVVPLASVRTQPDGSSSVRIVHDDNSIAPREVPVVIDMVADGYAAVSGDLAAGDLVAIGDWPAGNGP